MMRIMTNASTSSLVVELGFRVGADDEALLERTFSFARNLYSATLGTVLWRNKSLRESRAWKSARTLPEEKAANEFARLLRQADMSKNDFEKILNKSRYALG